MLKPRGSGRIVVLVAVVAAAVLAPAAASGAPPALVKRVRAADRDVAGMMDDGFRRSPTLRRLIAELERSNVIVYVGTSAHLPRTDLGNLHFVCARGRHRYLRISVRTRLGPFEFGSTLAHELQHAIEIAGHGDVVDQESMTALYQRIGRPSCGGWETTAAIGVANLVRGELENFSDGPFTGPR